MKKIVAIVLGVVVISGVVGAVVFFTTRTPEVGGRNVTNGTQYALNQVKISLFHHPDNLGMSNGQPLLSFDDIIPANSYCIFQNDFREFYIKFAPSSTSAYGMETYSFVSVTKPQHGKGAFNAQYTGVYNGDLWTYEVRATKHLIELYAVSRYTVKVADEGRFDSPRVEVFRERTPVMSFHKGVA